MLDQDNNIENTRPELRAGDDKRQIELQLEGGSEWAEPLVDWLGEHYPHLEARSIPGPGLIISIRVAAVTDPAFRDWHALLLAAMSSTDVALEIIAAGLHVLGVPVRRVLSIHNTAG